LTVARHFGSGYPSLTQVEYRIGCHSEERLAGGVAVGYPHLAVKARLRAGPTASCDSRRENPCPAGFSES
jgi:hypothetical protein